MGCAVLCSPAAAPVTDYPIVISAPPDFERMTRELTTLQSHMQRLEKELAASRSKETSLRNYIKAVKERLGTAEQKARAAERQLAERERVFKRFDSDMQVLREQIEGQQYRIAELEQSQTHDLLKRTALEQQLENMRRANAALNETLAAQTADIASLQDELDAYAEAAPPEAVGDDEALAGYRRRIAELEAELAAAAAAPEGAAPETEPREWQEEIGALKIELAEKNRILFQHAQEIEDLKQGIQNRDLLLEKASVADGTVTVLARNLNEYEKQIEGLQAGMGELQKQLDDALRTQREERDQRLQIESDLGQARAEAEALTRKAGAAEGEVRTLRQALQESRGLTDQMKEQIATQAADLQKAIEHRDMLRGEAFSADETSRMLSGHLSESEAVIESLRADLTDLKTRLREKTSAHEDERSHRLDLEAALDQAQRDTLALRQQISADKTEKDGLASRLDQAQAHNRQLADQLAAESADLRKAHDNRDALLAKIGDADNTVMVLSESLSGYENQISALQGGLTNLQAQLDAGSRALADEQALRAQAETALAKLRDDNELLTAKLSARADDSDVMRSALDAAQAREEELKARIEDESARADEAIRGRDELKPRLEGLEKDLRDARAQTREDAIRIATLTEKLTGLETTVAEQNTLLENSGEAVRQAAQLEAALADERAGAERSGTQLEGLKAYAADTEQELARERAARKAAEETRAAAEAEAAAVNASIPTLEEKIASLQQNLASRDAMLAEADKTAGMMAALENELAAARGTIATLESNATDLAARLSETEQSSAATTAERNSLLEAVNALRTENTTLNDTIAFHTKRYEELRAELAEKEKTFAQPQKQPAEVARLEGIISNQKAQLAAVNERAESMRTDLEEALQTARKQTANAASLEKVASSLRRDNAIMKDTLREHAGEIARLQQELDQRDLSQAGTAPADDEAVDLKRYETEIVDLREALSLQTQELAEAERARAKETAARIELTQQATELERQAAGLSETLQSRDAEIRSLRDSVAARDGMIEETAEADVAAAGLQDAADRYRQSAEQLQAQLAQQQARLDSANAEKERLAQALAAQEQDYETLKQSFAEREQALADMQWRLGTQERLLREAVDQGRDAKELTASQEEYEQTVSSLRAEIARRDQLLAEARQVQEQDKAKKSAAADAILKLRQQKDALEKELGDQRAELQQLQASASSLQKQAEDASISRSELEELKAALAGREREIEERTREIRSRDDRIIELERELAGKGLASEQAAQQEQSMAALRSTMERYESELASLRKRIGQQDELAADAGRKAREDAARAASLEKELDLARGEASRATELDQELASVRQELAAQKAALAAKAQKPASPPPAPVKTAAKAAPAPARQPARAPANSLTEAKRLLASGQTQNAQKLFEEALARDPASIEAQFGVAACSYAGKDLFRARRTLDKLLAASPNHAQALGLRGMIAYREDDLTAATEYLQRAVGFDPQDAQLHNYFGIVLHARLQQKPAIREFRKAIELDPKCAEAHYNLAYLLATAISPDLDSARIHYESAMRLGSARDEALEKILAK